MIIKSIPTHGLGEQQLTFRMASNAISYKIECAMAVLFRITSDSPDRKQLHGFLQEARALANSIVFHEDSDDASPVPLAKRPAGDEYAWLERREKEKQKKMKDTRKSLPKGLLSSRRTLKRLAQVSIVQDRSGEGEKRLKRPSKSWDQTVKQIHGAVSQGG